MKPTLVIIAAGMGNRYGGLKQIDPIGPNGEILIDYSIYDAVRAGFGKLVFVIRPDFEDTFKQNISGKFESNLEVSHVYQQTCDYLDGFEPPHERKKPWGTGHAILTAGKAVDEPFVAINADDYYGHNSFKIVADYMSGSEMRRPDSHAMVGYILRNTLSEHGHVSRAVCHCGPQMLLDNIVEQTKIKRQADAAVYFDESGKAFSLTGDEIVSMNFWAFGQSIFNSLQEQFSDFLNDRGHDPQAEFFIPTAVNNLIAAGKITVKVLKTRDRWFGITYRQDKASTIKNINKLIEEGVYPEKLW